MKKSMAAVMPTSRGAAAQAGTIENLERERSITLEALLSADLTPDEREERIGLSKARLVDLERMVDMTMFSTPMTGQSKYAREFAENVVAIERLVQAIGVHPLNGDSQIDGQPVSKQDYLRRLAAETEAELQIIDQEETILGYMAKLIALDALALTEELSDTAFDADEESREVGIAAAIDFFISE